MLQYASREISRLRRGFANSSSGEQAPRPPSCEREVDSMGKLIEPEDIAESILFLASRQARMITGQVIKVSGGKAL